MNRRRRKRHIERRQSDSAKHLRRKGQQRRRGGSRRRRRIESRGKTWRRKRESKKRYLLHTRKCVSKPIVQVSTGSNGCSRRWISTTGRTCLSFSSTKMSGGRSCTQNEMTKTARSGCPSYGKEPPWVRKKSSSSRTRGIRSGTNHLARTL